MALAVLVILMASEVKKRGQITTHQPKLPNRVSYLGRKGEL